MGRRVGGVDDAGRGCIIGPLVVAGVAMEESRMPELEELGVKDSKLLSPAGRRRLYSKIREVADAIVSIKVPPEEVDRFVARRKKFEKLNLLEAIAFSRVIGKLGAELVYVDASDTDVERFRRSISEIVGESVVVVSAHHADAKYPIVSAASIIAKVDRDAEVKKLKDEHGDFGSGYPSDPRTREFLRNWIERYGELPPFSRKTWKTWKKLGAGDLRRFSL